MKNTTVCTLYLRFLFARIRGRINNIAAPVVPIQLASKVPIRIINTLTIGLPTRLPLRLTPPEIVNNANNSIINGISPRLSQSGEFARDDSHGGVEEKSQSSHKRSQVVTTCHKWLEIGTTGQRTIHGVVAACVDARVDARASTHASVLPSWTEAGCLQFSSVSSVQSVSAETYARPC